LWRFDEAALLYQDALTRNPKSEEALTNLLAIALTRKDDEAVHRFAEQLLSFRPYSQAAMEGLATVAFNRGDYEAAAKLCQKLVELTPDHFERWFNFGVACQ
jgi:cytochrome c-type biogenesis protein CcmH/NrfG